MVPKQTSEWLKLIAVVSMLVDHIGYVFFSDIIILRAIGRIAFPLFCFQIAIGVQKSREPNAYQNRILIFALITQIPYTLLFGFQLNVLFTFWLAIFIVRTKSCLIGFICLIGSGILPFEYGWYGVAMVILFHHGAGYQNRWASVFTISLLTGVYSTIYSTPLQMVSLLSFVLIYISYPIKIYIPKVFFYWFYPVHIGVLYLIDLWI